MELPDTDQCCAAYPDCLHVSFEEVLDEEMDDVFDLNDGTDEVMTFECESCGAKLGFDPPWLSSICPVCGELT